VRNGVMGDIFSVLHSSDSDLMAKAECPIAMVQI